MTPMNDSERSCAHRPMSCDGPRGPCVACTIVERDELRAEVERLRADAEVRDFREGGLRQAVAVLTADRHCRHLLQQQAESRLAAANALLAKLPVVAVRGIPGLLCNLILEARAHLAAQPATVPSRFDGLPPFDKPAAAPVPLALNCPTCGKEHVDSVDRVTGIDWATRPHKTHLCLHCGALFKPHDHATVGVAQPATAPTDGTCMRCGSAPVNAANLCATCVDELEHEPSPATAPTKTEGEQ